MGFDDIHWQLLSGTAHPKSKKNEGQIYQIHILLTTSIFWDNLMFSLQLFACKRMESIEKIELKSAPLKETPFCKVSTSFLFHSNAHVWESKKSRIFPEQKRNIPDTSKKNNHHHPPQIHMWSCGCLMRIPLNELWGSPVYWYNPELIFNQLIGQVPTTSHTFDAYSPINHHLSATSAYIPIFWWLNPLFNGIPQWNPNKNHHWSARYPLLSQNLSWSYWIKLC